VTALLEDDLDTFEDIAPESVKASPAPVTGSRGTNRSPGGAKRTSAQTRKLNNLQARLSKEMFTAGAMIGMGLHVTGYYIGQESDNFTQAIVTLASKRPEWVEALEHIADVGPGLTVGRTVLGMGAALAVDRGRADPEKQFMKFLGVTAAWQAVTNPAGGGAKIDGSRYVPPPSEFRPVG
jgi:hypothetical protein